MFVIREVAGGVQFAVRVQPGAKREGSVGEYSDAVRIAIAAPAVDGKANDALVRYLSGALHVSRASVEIIAGHTSRSKVVRVLGVTSTTVSSVLMAALDC